MLKIFSVGAGRLTQKWCFGLSVQADPHYILGVAVSYTHLTLPTKA